MSGLTSNNGDKFSKLLEILFIPLIIRTIISQNNIHEVCRKISGI